MGLLSIPNSRKQGSSLQFNLESFIPVISPSKPTSDDSSKAAPVRYLSALVSLSTCRESYLV